MQANFVLMLILNISLGGALSLMWNIFNTLQLVTQLPKLNVRPPVNILAVYDSFDELANFQIFPKETLQNWLIDSFIQDQDLRKALKNL